MSNPSIVQVLKLTTEFDGAGLEKAKHGLDATEKKASGLGHAFGGATKAAAGLTLGVGALGAGLGAVAVKQAAEFEQAVANVGSVTGATKAELKLLSDAALQVGKDTSKSASESVEAFGELLKAGMSVQDVVGGAGRTVVQLAEATGASVADMAQLLSNTLNTFGLSADQAANVANTLARAANASAIDVADLAQSLQAVGPVAKQAGLSTDEFATAIGLMGNHALKGSDAGTSLKTMLLALTAPTDKARGLMAAYGISVFDAQGKIRGFRDILGDLQTSLKGLSDQEKSAALKDIFGTDAIRAANILLDEGTAGWDNFATAMGKAPSVAEMSAARLNTLQGRIEQIKGSLETLAITVGSKLLPPITWLAQHALDWVNSLLDADPEKLFSRFAGVTDRIRGLFDPRMASVTDADGNEWTMRLASPFEAASIRIGEAADRARERLNKAWAGIVPEAAGAGSAILTAFSAVGEWFSQHWETIWGVVGPVVSLVTDLVQDKLENLLGVIRGVFQVIGGLFTGDWGKAWEGLKTIARSVLADIGDTFGFFKDLSVHIFGQLKDGAVTVLGSLWQWLRTESVDWVKEAAPALLSKLGDLLGQLGGWISDTALPLVGEKLRQWGGAFVAWVVDVVPPLLAEMGRLALRLGDWLLMEGLPGLITKLGEWAAAFVAWILPVAGHLITEGVNLIGRLGQWIKSDGAPALLTHLAHWVASFVDWVADVAPRILPLLWDVAKFIGAFLRDDAVPYLAKAAGRLGGAILGAIVAPLRALGRYFAEPLNVGIGVLNKLLDAVNWVLGKLGIESNLHLNLIPSPADSAGPAADYGGGGGDGAADTPGITAYARGGRNIGGGLALVGEEGPELVELPHGANVYSAGQTRGLLGRGGPPNPFGWATDALGSVSDWIRDGAASLLMRALQAAGALMPDLPGIGGDIARGVFGTLRDAAVSFVQRLLDGEARDRGAAGAWSHPLRGAMVTQRFGERPEVYGGGGHTGIDLAGLPIGAAVTAAKGGDVTGAGPMGGYGNAVVLQHLEGLASLYGHLDSTMTAIGASLRAGGAVGGMGWSGNVEPPGPAGAHLHFEIRRGGVPVDPERYMRFAGGGVIRQRTLLVDPATGRVIGEAGEAGAEAIVPLGRGGERGAASVDTVNLNAQTVNVGGVGGDRPGSGAAPEQRTTTKYQTGITVDEVLNHLGILDLLKSTATDEFGTFESISPGFDLAMVLGAMGMSPAQLMAAIATNPAGLAHMIDDLNRRTRDMRSSRNPASSNFNPAVAAMATFGLSATPDAVRSLINDPADAALFDEALRAAGGDVQRAGQLFAEMKAARDRGGAASLALVPGAPAAATPAGPAPLSGDARRQWDLLGGEINDLNVGISNINEDLRRAREQLAGLDPDSPQAAELRALIDELRGERARLERERTDAVNQQAEIGRTGQATAQAQQQAGQAQIQAATDQGQAATDQGEAAADARVSVDQFGNTVDEFGGVVETLAEAMDRAAADAAARGDDPEAAAAAEREARRREWERQHPGEVAPFALGGLISSPTLLTDAASGRVFGVMAESGPEWIVPARMGMRGGLLPTGKHSPALAQGLPGEGVVINITGNTILDDATARTLARAVADEVDRALAGRL